MCDHPVTWTIEYGDSPDDYTESCPVHLAEMTSGCISDSERNGRGGMMTLIPTHDPTGKTVCCHLSEDEQAAIVGRASCGHVNNSATCTACEYVPPADTPPTIV